MNLLWQKELKNQGLYVDILKNHDFDRKYLYATEFLSETTAKMAALKLTQKNDKKSSDYRTNGNKKFKEKKWLEAMSLYNQSLCYAEIGSENVSLAYANRSACFLHFKLFDKCLVDIELAKQANYPANLMPKLNKRRDDCLKLMDTFEDEHKLSYEADEKFPGMTNVLEIRCDKKFGRHIVAKTDIPAGKNIFAEKPFITRSLNTDYNSCAVCMNISMNFIACSKCTTALFCSSECANANDLHKMDCGQNLPQNEAPLKYYMGIIIFIISIFTNVEDLIEFVQEAIKKERIKAPNSLNDVKSKFRALLQLSICNSTTEKSREHLGEAYVIYKSLQLRESIKKLFQTEEKKRFLMHLVLHLKCVLSNNGFTIPEYKMSIYIIASYFNHACASNVAAVVTDKNVRYCRTTRPIKAGQQLFITYLGDLFCESSVEYCQTFLYEHFGFRCKCERCKPNMRSWEMNSYNMQSDPDFQFLNRDSHEYMKIGVGGKEDKRTIYEKKMIDVLNRYGDKHWCDELAATIENYETYFILS